jgi:hypothetical protein
MASVGPTIKRAVLQALREGSFLLSGPARQDFFFSNWKKKEEKKENDCLPLANLGAKQRRYAA